VLDALGGRPLARARPTFPARVGEPIGQSVKLRLCRFQRGNDLG
jgi:hypothetical protein